MHICAYSAISDPITAKLPIYECIEALYDHVDEFCIFDCSIYDNVDLTKYAKVRKHVRGLFNPFDDPFGSIFTQALRLCDSDTVMFIDIDEIFDFKGKSLKDVISKYPLDGGAGVAFSLLNYYCSRNFTVDGCSSKGPHIFRNRPDIFHDMIGQYAVNHNHIRRTCSGPDLNDGVRIVFEDGRPMSHYPPIPLDDVTIHHTSHLCPVSKMVRSVMQFNHTSSLDLPEFYPFDMRFQKSTVDKIYELGLEDLKSGNMILYGNAIPFEYKPNQYLDAFIGRANIYEFDPSPFTIAPSTKEAPTE